MIDTQHGLLKVPLTTLASASLAALLSACGAGDISDGDGEKSAPTKLHGTVMTSDWTKCAVEDGTCSFTGTKQVRYGLDGKYASRTLTGPVACNNATFGDPYPGVDKICEISDPPAPTTTTTTSWVRCAAEYSVCSFSGTRQVRYGLSGKYSYRTATNSIGCNNQNFGDPVPGQNKFCDYAVVTSTTTSPTPTPTPTPPTANALLTDSVLGLNSFWYKPIPASTPLHPQSAAFVSEFLRQKAAYYGNVNLNTASYSSPVYIADATTPTKRVAYWDCTGKGFVDQSLVAQWASVPIPAAAKPSAGTDGEMTVYQPSTNTLWEFWQASNTNGQWRACWGGQLKSASSGNGIWPNPYGTTATGLPFIGGQVTAEELKRGEIRHVIGIALVDLAHYNIFYWPANRSDGYNPNNAPNRIPEGTRFRLDPSINVDALNISAAAKTIAKAGQKYGFVVWDHAGSLSIRAQNVVSYTALGQANPYPALFGGLPEYSVLNGIPWDRLQFLPKDYGKP
ncbi:hypothetical protein [Pseudoduganella namucuonensis]|uniref:DUF4124 domain-containing protein n=1 Tax=Pseudoduganella namucuonensis TaxID=1035707 RepID=A0A1I7M509_9BURK|nr:hypothetical protein [Pseudoduganella namucuonensis]SFV17006.1 hypothetical protein SAMN05216552_10586 [Pseudoduganella namucuonensis]